MKLNQIENIMRIYKKPKTDLTTLFKNHEGLLKNKANFYSQKYSIEFEEVYSQALEIFVITFNKWEPIKAKFTTFLISELRRLNYFCKKEIQSQNKIMDFEDFNKVVENLLTYEPEYSFELINSMETELSSKAQEVILNLLRGEFQEIIKRKNGRFDEKILKSKFNWSLLKARKVLKEIRFWWINFEKEYLFI